MKEPDFGEEENPEDEENPDEETPREHHRHEIEKIWHMGPRTGISFSRLHDGVLYFGAFDDMFYAVDAESGRELWRFRTGGVITGRPAVGEGLVFVPSHDTHCYALEAGSGKERWRFRAHEEIFGGPAFSGEVVVLGTMGGYVEGLDTEGDELWTFKTGGDVISSPTIHGGRVFIGSTDCHYYCLDLLTGKELWRFRTGGLIHNNGFAPTAREKIFITSFDNYLYCLDLRTGKELWRFRTGEMGMSDPPAYHDGMVYQGTREGILYAIDMHGMEKWRYITGGLLTQPLIARSRLYFGCEDEYFRCLDLDGKEAWRFKAEGKMWDIPSFWKGNVVFGTWSCHVHAVDALTGKEAWRFVPSTSRNL